MQDHLLTPTFALAATIKSSGAADMQDHEVLPKFALSGAAACAAETVTYPLDFLKSRMQLNHAASPPGLAVTAATVIRHEGVAALYTGLPPALLRHLPYTGIRVVLFEQLRAWGCSRQPDGQLPLALTMAAGLTAGAVGQLAATPADLLKVRLVADPQRPSLSQAWSNIVRAEGVAGLWQGSLPAVQRAALVNLGELATYDAAKRAVLRSEVTGGDNVAAHALSAVASGFFSSLISTPVDVVKTRLMAQNPRRPQYRGMADCLAQTWRGEGLQGLFKGFIPTWARLGPWQLTFWVTVEQLRSLAGLQSF